MQLDTGHYGAKVQTWRKNPRELLRQLITEYPDRSELFAAFRARVRDDEEYMGAVLEYWFTNNLNSLMAEQPAQRTERKKVLAKATETLREKVKGRIEVILLDMVMPNSKALRDCTGRECAAAGGWLVKVAGKVGPDEVVGAVMGEEEVRALYR